MNKTELRKLIRAQKREVTAQQLAQFSASVCRQLLASSRWKAAQTVLLYASLPDEVDTSVLLIDALKAEKRALLPVVKGDVLELKTYHEVTETGSFGIQEPVGEAFFNYDEIDLAIIPGMAFDVNGHRLGRGKGYYDRLLPLISAYKIGLCFPFQLVDEVPFEPHDQIVNEVISKESY